MGQKYDPQRLQVFLSREATAAVRAMLQLGRAGNCKELVDAAVVAYCLDLTAKIKGAPQ